MGFFIYHTVCSDTIDVYLDGAIQDAHTVFVYFSGFNGDGKIRLFDYNDYYSIDKLFDKIDNMLRNGINVVLFMDMVEIDHSRLYRFWGYKNFGFIARIRDFNQIPKDLYVNLRNIINGVKSVSADIFFDFFQNTAGSAFYIKPPKTNFDLFVK